MRRSVVPRYDPAIAVAHGTLRRLAAPALAVLVAVSFAAQARAWAFLSDDAFISFRVARQWARAGAPEYNPGEAVESYTNFGWVALLALGDRLGVAPHDLAPWLTQAGAAAASILACLLGRALRGCDRADPWQPIDLIPAALLVASPEFVVWAHGGLETSTTTALVVTTIVAWLRRHPIGAGTAAAGAILMRPDAALPLAAFAAAWAASGRRREPPLDRRSIALGCLAFASPVLLHLLWRHEHYGAWLPHTWTLKQHGYLLRDTYGRAYVEAWVRGVHLLHLAPLAVLLRFRHGILVLPILVVLLYGWSVGGDFMAYGRFYLSATVLLAVLVGWLLADLRTVLARRGRRRLAELPLALGLLLAAGLALESHQRWEADRARPQGWLDGRWEGVTAMDRFARVGLAAGQWMRAHLPGETPLVVGAAGALPYASELPAYDAFGLVDPRVPTLPGAGPHAGPGVRPGHQFVAPPEHVRARAPELVCHVGHRGSQRPGRAEVHPAFAHGYRWACLRLPPLEAPSGAFDPGYYCCRRPTTLPLSPFVPGAAG